MDEEYVIREEFVPGDFVKYINNSGEICSISDHVDADILHKAEALAHFS